MAEPDTAINIVEIALDKVDQEVLVYDENLIITGYNRRFLEILGLAPDRISPGDPFSKMVRIAAEDGWYGPGNGTLDDLVEARIKIARSLKPHRQDHARLNN